MKSHRLKRVLQVPRTNPEGEKEEKTTKGEVVAANGKGGKTQ
jgi:hypothetical protein